MATMLLLSKKRSLLIGFLFACCLGIILLRLLWLQTIEAEELLSKGQKAWIVENEPSAKRGTIYDRTKEHQYAWEVDAYRFVVDPERVQQPEETAKLLAPILQVSEEALLEKLKKKEKYVELKFDDRKKFSWETYEKFIALRKKKESQLNGVNAYLTSARLYHDAEAAHVVGYINDEGKTLGGVESMYDEWLRGQKGKIRFLQAKNGIMVSDQPIDYKPPVPGKDLVLTLDASIQHQLELELEKAVKTYHAKGATAIVADPKTGEILAMANRPTVDLSRYSRTYQPGSDVNQAVQSQFEPGSTFKMVTLSAAVEEGIFHPEDTFQSGSISIGGQTIRDWNGKGWGTISYRQGVQNSSNVAFVKLGQQLGGEKLIRYIDRFGFGDITARSGKQTGIDLPGEGKGYYYNKSLYPAELASTAFGQGISVTPIQQVAAISAIANGGIWVQPHVMKEIWDPVQQKIVKQFQPKRHRILKTDTAKQVRALMRGVVANGTGVEAEVRGYQVAGKTGTAQKPNPRGGYLKGRYVVSFIGFAPYDDPDVVVYIAIDEPSSIYGGVSGGKIAAPIARDILHQTLQMRRVQPTQQVAETLK
jgi:stage V sporulation protein D (sporulation-specific penicillin-binding protein)